MRKTRCDFGFAPRPLHHLLTVALAVIPASANPLIPKEFGVGGLTLHSLFGRGDTCNSPCGWSGQLCCKSNEACITDSNNWAQCTVTTAAANTETTGYWKYWTSSWVETETDVITRYSTGSSWCGDATSTAAAGGGGGWVASSTAAVTTPTATAVCNWDKQESSCGTICCASDQYCVTPGQCGAAAASSKLSSGSSAGISPAILPTSSTMVIVTATSSPTTTVPFLAPVATGANVTLTEGEANTSSGLSGGAIAGIVIGVIAAIILLILLCLYCCARSIWALLFGGRKKRTERTEYIESRHHRSYGGAGGAAYAAGRPDSRRWYGSEAPRKEKKKGGLGGMLGIGAGLAGLAAVLGLKRRHDRKHRDEKSDFSSNYTDASYSYYTSASSESSDDRRTRATRDTRRSSRHR